jgi:hypothetical protein
MQTVILMELDNSEFYSLEASEIEIDFTEYKQDLECGIMENFYSIEVLTIDSIESNITLSNEENELISLILDDTRDQI